MPARFFAHLGFLGSAIALTFFWTKSATLSPWTLQLIAFLIIFYFLNKKLARLRFSLSLGIDGLILSFVTLLLVSQSGGLSSPLFFLVYILLFGLTFLFDPLVIGFFTVFLVLLFFGELRDLTSLLQVVGLLLMTPLALFFGRQYLKVLESEQKIKILKEEKRDLASEVSEQEKDTLLWLSLPFKEHIINILDASSQLLSSLSKIPPIQRDLIAKIHENARNLIKKAGQLEEEIEG